MIELVEFPLDADGSVFVEVDVPEEEQATRIGISDKLKTASASFEKSLAVLQPVGRAIVQQLRDLGPQEVSLEFGFKMSGEQGIILAKAGVEANFKVTLTWKDPSEPK